LLLTSIFVISAFFHQLRLAIEERRVDFPSMKKKNTPKKKKSSKLFIPKTVKITTQSPKNLMFSLLIFIHICWIHIAKEIHHKFFETK